MKRLLVLAALALITTNASAATTTTHRNYGGSLRHEILLTATNGALSFDQDGANFGLQVGYGYLFTDMWEGIGSFGVDTGAGVTAWYILVGPRVNFPGEPTQNAFFADGQIGLGT